LCHVFRKGEGTKKDSSSRIRKTKPWFGVLEQEIDKCKRLFYDLQIHREMRYNAKKIKDEEESLLLSFKSIYTSG